VGSVNCVSAWAKAVQCVAASVHISMVYLNITFINNKTELFTTASDDYEQQLTADDRYIKQMRELGLTVVS